MPAIAAVLAADSATAGAIGCPTGAAVAATLIVQTMQGGWLIDAGQPGAIYAVFGIRTWRLIPGRSVEAVIQTGTPPSLGAPLGQPWPVRGLVQRFEGGVAIYGPEGYIFVLLNGGQARVY